MLTMYYNDSKNIIVQHYENEIGMSELEVVKKAIHKFRSWRNATVVVIHAENSFFVDKEFPKEAGKIASQNAGLFTEFYVIGLLGIQKVLFKLFTTFVKQDVNYHVATKVSAEIALGVKLSPPFNDFKKLTFNS